MSAKPKPYDYLSEAERELRRRLRVHGRQLGDERKASGVQEIDRLLEEVAYEHWHRMLFARFLAENNLLMYPDPTAPGAGDAGGVRRTRAGRRREERLGTGGAVCLADAAADLPRRIRPCWN